MCIAKKNIDYNSDAIKPFLCKKMQNPGKFFHGEAAYAGSNDRDCEYYFHVTTLSNFRGILEQGLLSSHGGTGGAGQIMANGQFKYNEIGHVFATSYPHTVDNYIYNYDEDADRDITHTPILLRFKPLSNDGWSNDPCDPNAVRTKLDIAPHRLDFLSFEGWVSLQKKECRDIIGSIIGEILN